MHGSVHDFLTHWLPCCWTIIRSMDHNEPQKIQAVHRWDVRCTDVRHCDSFISNAPDINNTTQRLTILKRSVLNYIYRAKILYFDYYPSCRWLIIWNKSIIFHFFQTCWRRICLVLETKTKIKSKYLSVSNRH